jgi:kynureninase
VLAHADYRSSARWDMAAVNAQAHAVGALVLWDLSHTAGVVRVDLDASGADFAVCCGYKYLCAGPGAAALAYIRRELQDRGWPALPGWLGHADRLNFRSAYAPAPGVSSLVGGTMPVLQNVVMECAARIWAKVEREQVFAKHRSLSLTLAALVREQCAGLGVTQVSPADYECQGGHLAFSCPGGGATCEALLDAGVVASFRQPDVIRFGLSPATLRHVDLWHAVAHLRAILVEERWRDPRFQAISI